MNRPRAHSATSPSAAPTRARYGVVGFAVALAVIQYIDRVCISQAAPFVSEDLGLSPRQMGYVFSAFTLAYEVWKIVGTYDAEMDAHAEARRPLRQGPVR